MPICPYRLASISEFLHDNPTAGRVTISKATGIPPAAVARALRALRSEKPVASAAVPTVPKEGKQVEFSKTSGEASLVSKRVLTLENLIEQTRVDLKIWEVDRHLAHAYPVASKDSNGKVVATQMHEIKAWFKRRAPVVNAKAVHELLEKAVKGLTPPPRKFTASPLRTAGVSDPHLLEVSFPDIHVGKLVWGKEIGGKNGDIKTTITTVMAAAEDLWYRASVFPIDAILLPLGNDFHHTDTPANTTTAGTAVDADSRWQKSFSDGVELAIKLIEFFRGKTPGGIDVLMIAGNHDTTRNFFMGSVLAAMYRNSPDVRIDNSPNVRKYFRYGTTLLGFTHGDKEKAESLPLVMAGERPDDWAATTYREWHLGHRHHMKETRYVAGNEFSFVRVRILSALTSTDAYHHNHGYVGSQQAAEVFLWAYKTGYRGHLSYTVPK
jgi:hypothetical protein